MNKSPDAFRTISEVADWLGIQAHVLRFWESKFNQVKPVKRAGGRRYYRPSDMQLIGGIKRLLYEDGMTIKGVQKILREQGVDHVISLSAPLNEMPDTTPKPATPQVSEEAKPVVTEQPAEPEIVETASVAPEVIHDSPRHAEEPRPSFTPAPVVTETPETPSAETTLKDEPPVSAATTAREENDDSDATIAPEPEALSASSQDYAQEDLPLAPTDTVAADSQTGDHAAEEISTADSPEPAAPRPVPKIVDAPDPSAESEIRSEPGVLSSLGALNRLDPAQARGIAAHVKTLENCMNKLSGVA